MPRECLPSLLDRLSALYPSSAEIFGQTGCGFGGFAEYVCVPETALALMPESMTKLWPLAVRNGPVAEHKIKAFIPTYQTYLQQTQCPQSSGRCETSCTTRSDLGTPHINPQTIPTGLSLESPHLGTTAPHIHLYS